MGIALPLLAGAGAGWIGSALFGGGTKKEQSTYAPTITYPYAQYSPVRSYQISPQIDYTWAPIIESPGATGSTVTTKKESSQTAETSPTITPSISPTVSPAQTDINFGSIIILVIIIAIAGYFLTRKKSKK